MAVERSFFGSLNYIRFMTQQTCDDKWDLIVETALPALGEAMYVLIVPDPDEILENYLQPRPKRSTHKSRHIQQGSRTTGRTGSTRTRLPGIVPDVDSLIANMIPGRDFFRGRSAGRLERWVWTGIDVLDRIAWYWLLLDIGENFVHYWSSNIMESRFCTSNFDAMFSGSYVSSPINMTNPEWNQPESVTQHVNKGWIVQNSGAIARIDQDDVVSGHIIWQVDKAIANPTPHQAMGVFPRLIYVDDRGVQHNIDGEPVFIGTGDTQVSLMMEAEIPLCRRIFFRVLRHSGALNLNVSQAIGRITFLADRIK